MKGSQWGVKDPCHTPTWQRFSHLIQKTMKSAQVEEGCNFHSCTNGRRAVGAADQKHRAGVANQERRAGVMKRQVRWWGGADRRL